MSQMRKNIIIAVCIIGICITVILICGITTEMYDRKLKEQEEQISEISSKMIKYNKADESFYITANQVLNLAQRAAELFESSEPEEKRQLLNFAFQNFRLNGKNLSFKLKTPLDGVLIGTTTNNWGRIVEDVRTIFAQQDEYIYIPDLRSEATIEIY